ncbi:MAG TPA: hypothetical protein PK400_06720 [Phycisphaerales bacterium]|nr:hypothetical protein [Phycisphaerales bacterium]
MAHRTSPRRQLLEDCTPPPKVRTSPKRPLMLIGFAAVLFCVLLLVVLNLDTGTVHDQRADADDPRFAELIAPRPLSEGDLRSPSNLSQPPQTGRGVITLQDKDGNLSHRYTYESLDPSPEGLPSGWLKLGKPRMEAFLANDRRLVIEGDQAIAYRPQSQIEEGTIEGNVIVRLFDMPPHHRVDLSIDEPVLIVRTDAASFENFLGVIRCEDWVRIETATMTLPGHDLSVLVDDRDNTVQLTMRRFDYIEILSEDSSPAPQQSQTHAFAPHEPTRTAQATPTPSSAQPPAQPQTQPAAQRSAQVAAASQPAAAPRSTAQPAQTTSSKFYLLTIRDEVLIEQTKADGRRTAMGEKLELIFSTESEGLDGSLSLGSSVQPHHVAHQPPIRRDVPAHPLSRDMILASLAIGTAQDWPVGQPAQQSLERTIITARGPLVIVPLSDSSRRPASEKDAVLELTGSPVLLCDHANGSESIARTLRYDTGPRSIELIGSHTFPMHLSTPEFEASGSAFRVNQTTGEGAIVGAGWMKRRELSSSATMGLLCAGSSPPQRVPRPTVPETITPELQITWQGGVDLTFDSASADERMGKLRSALFTGDVKVVSDEFTMDSETMLVMFPPGAGDPEAIERIEARGGVRVVGVTDGTLLCRELDLDMTQSSEGKTIPKEMLARGDVQAEDESQVVWSDTLRVTFRETMKTAGDAAPRPERAGARGEVDVDELLAEGSVQVLMADGSRAFADRLLGDGANETVTLLGEDVVVASDRMMMSRGKRLVLSRKEGTATSIGPGVFRLYHEPVLGEPEPRRIAPPDVNEADNPIEVRATWKESMVYDSNFNDGAGSVVLRGDVDVLAEPSPLERSTMTGQALTLEFRKAEGAQAARPAPLPIARTGEARRDADGGRRELARLIARRNAKLESHSWDKPALPSGEREGEPVIFYVSGEHIEHDAKTGESLVVGKGDLLIHDTRAENDAERLPQHTPFGSRGTTKMSWGKTLHLVPRVDEIYDITAMDKVEMIHRGLDGAISTMTAERVEATVLRPIDSQRQPAAADMGAPAGAKLERVRGMGGVIIKTDRREIECGEFDYNIATGIAQLHAARHGRVSVVTRGVVQPLFAERAVWDMNRDAIQVVGPTGGGPR